MTQKARAGWIRKMEKLFIIHLVCAAEQFAQWKICWVLIFSLPSPLFFFSFFFSPSLMHVLFIRWAFIFFFAPVFVKMYFCYPFFFLPNIFRHSRTRNVHQTFIPIFEPVWNRIQTYMKPVPQLINPTFKSTWMTKIRLRSTRRTYGWICQITKRKARVSLMDNSLVLCLVTSGALIRQNKKLLWSFTSQEFWGPWPLYPISFFSSFQTTQANEALSVAF